MVSYRVIGQPVPRADGVVKATGTARYTADLSLPGTLWGKSLRSPFPHARITRVDTSRAKQVPGVYAVLTGADVRGVLFGRQIRDVPVLAQDRVLFAGERVAAVAAVDRDTARQALDLIVVEYEELPAIFDVLEALKEDAPLLHPNMNSYQGVSQPLDKPSNAFIHKTWGQGDVEEGFTQADLVVENTYTTPLMHQAYLEPHTCLVWIDDEGRVQVYASSKIPYKLKEMLAEVAGIPEERIRVNHTYVGGDFGGKGFPQDLFLSYFLALHAGRPVKMVMEYVEELQAANPRHPSIIRMKTGVKRDGRLTAHQAQVIYKNGAYGGYTPQAYLVATGHAAGLYKVPHVLIEASHVYTNTVPSGYMRAPGSAPGVFAVESHMDAIAHQLGMDPLEFRLKNLVEEGDSMPDGEHFQGLRAKETLAAAVEAAGYRAPKPPSVGRGIAMGHHSQKGSKTHAAVTLSPDGSVTVNTPIFEQGTGTYTVLRQVVAEELGFPAEQVRVEVWDTDAVPFDEGVLGGRVTRSVVLVAHQACQEARQEMLRLAAETLGWPEESMELHGEHLIRKDTGETKPWAELLARFHRPIMGRASTEDMSPATVTAFVAQVAEVSVDPETGEIRLLRFTTAHDVGTVLNPIGHQGQIDGGFIQGMGYALMEELGLEEGRVTTASFGDYKIPTIRDIPPMQTVLLEPTSGMGPYNIKGIGEGSLSPVASAIANALEDAVGVRIRDLPITAEKVYRALSDKGR